MKYCLPVVLAFTLLLLTSCGDDKKKFDGKTYQEQKLTLAAKERKTPLAFLSISSRYKRNFFGQTVVKAIVHNNATFVAYRNVRVKLLYYKQQKLVANHEEVYDETISPGEDLVFKARFRTPRGIDSVATSLMSAIVVEEVK